MLCLLLSIASLVCAVHAGSRAVWPPSAYAKANATLAQLTTAEKVQLASGNNLPYASCHFSRKECSYVGFIEGIPRLGLSPIYMEDGPQGVADGMTGVTQWPSIMTLSQAWRPDLVYQMGAAMGEEQKAKGSNVMLGPAVALVRTPLSGRNFEYMSEDPYLNAALAGPMVTGIQSNSISACVKHWIFNSQESDRSGMSSNVPERVGRELYEAPYKAAVDAGVGSVMCSFNRINTTWSCANGASLNDWLKGDLGFDGFVVSDWGAQHNTSEFALGGLDMEQEWVKNATYYGPTLLEYVTNGTIPMSRLDDMARRILIPMYALGYDTPSPPSAGPNATANTTAHGDLALAISSATPVLLKNEGGLLPLSPTTTLRIAVIGDDGVTGGGGSGQVVPPIITPLFAATKAEFPSAHVTYFQGNTTAAAAVAAASDIAVVVVSVWGSEGSDRANLSLGCPPMAGPKSCLYWPDQDALVEAVAAAAPHTVVVVRAPGAVLMPWLPRVSAVLNQLFGGQAANTVLPGVLSGRYNPAGKLTVSFPTSLNDTWLSWPATNGPINPTSYPGTDRGRGFPEVDYNEGLFVGYKWFDGRNTTPLFPFGHGLSFSSFSYSQLTLPSSPLTPASPAATIAFTLTLTSGATTGGEVAQLYIQGGLPGDPPKQLKGFQYTLLTPQTPSATVSFDLSLTKDLVVWDTVAHAFLPYPPGTYSVFVGSSSRDIRLQGTIQVGA